MPKQFVEHFKKVIEEKSAIVETSVLHGSPSTLEGYKELVGKIKAFDIVLEDLDYELQKYIEEDND